MSGNIIDFNDAQCTKFDEIAECLIKNQKQFLDFENVSDFYKASWLNEFPSGTNWYCSGLDDGADEFYAVIQFKNRKITITKNETIKIRFEKNGI